MSDEAQAAGTVETKADTKKSPADFFKHWMQAIDMAGTDEENWRKDAEECLKRYSAGKARGFNILYANTQTTVPALYNSEPAPDIRRRFDIAQPTPPQINPQDPSAQALQMAAQTQAQQAQQAKQQQDDSKQVCTALERAVSVQAELYNFDGAMQAAVRDRQLPGRGVTRVRVCIGAQGSKWIVCEPVQWDAFRHGPGKTFKDWPWIAFRHELTREELVELSPKTGRKVKLDATVGDAPKKAGDNDKLPDMFKRAVCWEVWDKQTREVYWFAESFKDGPVTTTDDPYQLRDFLSIVEPLYQVKLTNSTTPVCEYKLWKPLADEMDSITGRIIGIIKVMKLRGLYDGTFANIVEKMSKLEDGELASADDAARSMKDGGIEKAVWMWPVDMAIKVVEGLYTARQQAKEAVYEFTGVADILRGQTDPNETLGAQRIKAQWGSLRLQESQRDVQRYARDLFRMMADLMAYVWTPEEWTAVTGLQLNDAQFKLLKNDLQREFAIEIETDSTIRADLSRAQENISGFVTGLGGFMEAVGPAVEAGMMPAEIAVKYIGAFSRNFKLGREAEDLTDEWVKYLEEKAKNPQPPQKDPKVQAEEIKAQSAAATAKAKQDEIALKGQVAQQDARAKAQDRQMNMQERVAEFQMRMKELQAEMAVFQMEQQGKAQDRQAEAAIRLGEHQLHAQEVAQGQEAAQHGHGLKMEVMDAQAKAKTAAARKPNGGAR